MSKRISNITKNLHYFLIGFLLNACIWRISSGQTDDIVFPLTLLALQMAFLITSNWIEFKKNLKLIASKSEAVGNE